MSAAPARRIFGLCGFDPETSAATAVIGVVGIEQHAGGTWRHHVSYVPLEEDTGGWHERLERARRLDETLLDTWSGQADGVSWDIIELEAEEMAELGRLDLYWAVESVIDDVLAAPPSRDTEPPVSGSL